MTEILFIQGGGEDVHDGWDLAMVESLRRELGPGHEVRYPRMPHEDDPSVAAWTPALERELAVLENGAVVVGHSIGGAILIDVLAGAAPSVELGAIVLIAAPFIGEGGWKSEEAPPRSRIADSLPANVPVLLYHGEDDDIVPAEHVALYARTIPGARVRRLAGRDHQLNNDLSEVASDIRVIRVGPPTSRLSRPSPDSRSMVQPRLTVLTLGVDDLQRAVAFYRDGLGWKTPGIVGTEFEHGAVAFFDLQPGLRLALWARADLAHDAGLPLTPPSATECSLGHNVESAAAVDAVMATAERAGARIVKPAGHTFYGGYAGYFQDPDGHLWEVVWNPAWTFEGESAHANA